MTSVSTNPVDQRRFGALCVVTAAVLWSLWSIWVRWGGGESVATMAFLVAGVCGLPFALRESFARGRRPGRAWALLVLLSVMDAANTWCYFRALGGALAPAILSHYVAPVLVALAAPILLHEARSPRTPQALVLALGGTALLVFLGKSGAGGGSVSRGLGYGFASALFYAGNVIVARRLSRDLGDFELMIYHALIAALVLAPATGIPLHAAAWKWPLVGGLVSSLAAGVIYYAGLRRISAETSAILTYVEPVAALGVAWIVFHETPTIAAIAGGALVVTAGIIVIGRR